MLKAQSRASGNALLASMKSTVTKQSIVQALHDILPSMHADTATLKMVIEKLAVHFDVEFLDLKAQWRPQIKALLPDLIRLCASGCDDKSDGEQFDDVEDEEVLDLRPRRTRTVCKRHLVEDEDDDGVGSGASDCSAGERVQDQGGDNDGNEDNGASVKRKGRVVRVLHEVRQLLIFRNRLCRVMLIFYGASLWEVAARRQQQEKARE